MDKNREARRASIVGSDGFNRRKHRTNSLRDSPEEDGGVELQESIKSRDRVKKDRERDLRDRGRDLRGRDLRERDRDLRERSGRIKRRRVERLMTNRDEIGTSEDSENEDLDAEYEETTTSTTSSAVPRLLPAAAGSISNHHESHLINQHHQHNHGEQQHPTCNSTTNSNMISGNHHLQHRKSFPPVSVSSSSKAYRVPPVWNQGDEMIGVSVPRKARSASTKRLHDWASSSSHNNSSGCGGGVAGGDQILRQSSISPVRQAPTASPAPPVSPSSSNASTRKKLKPSGGSSNLSKLKPPKASLKLGSSNPGELEIEIAEVLYGLMTQSQAPSSTKEDLREVNRLTGDAKSRLSPLISNTTAGNSLIPGPNSTPLSAVAPKRKRPRQVLENPSFGARNSPKPEPDQTPKLEISFPNLERISGSSPEKGFEIGGNMVNSQAQPAAQPTDEPESMKLNTEPKPVVVAEMVESRDLVAKEEVGSPKEEESPASRTGDFNHVDSASASMASIATDAVSATEIKDAFVENRNLVESEIENLRQEKFQIDLMARPPQGRSSPERDTAIDSRAAVLDEKPVPPVLDIRTLLKNQENGHGKRWRDENAAAEEKKGKVTGGEEAESNKEMENKVKFFDLKLDLENGERDLGGGVDTSATGNKEESLTEKAGQSTKALPLPMSMASWSDGLPPMGYMAAPLQGVIPIDGTSVNPSHLQSFAQPRPKRCATHCYIARNIHSLQQFMKMHPFWPVPAGSPTLFGPKTSNLNVIPAPANLHGNIAIRGAQDKGQSIANANHDHVVRDKASKSVTTTDSDQRKQQQQRQQILIQQGLPLVPPSNLLAPAFIFPLNQHQAAVPAASVQHTLGKSSSGGSTAASSNISSSGVASASVPAGGASAPMNFNYPPNMAVNETQYLAILNNAYPFTIPAAAAVGAPTNYRGTPGQAMPVFNGSFVPSQMIHPSQIQQHQQQPASSTPSHQITSVSGSSSFSQKHLQSQQRPQSSSGPVNANTQNRSSHKTQQSQQLQNQHVQRQRHLENDKGSDDSPLDNRGLPASMNLYGQNFALPIIHPQNFALMTPPTAAMTNASSSGNQNEKPQQPQQQPPPHSFAMSFGSINGGSGIDLSSMTQNHAFFQNFPEAARQNLQMMAAAQVAQKKNFRISEDGNNKSSGGCGDSSAGNDDERKNTSMKNQSQSVAFARSDLGDAPNNVIESSARSLNVASGSARSSQATTNIPNNIPNAHIQSQLQQQQMLQLKNHQQHQQQQQQLAGNVANIRNKTPVSNGNLYSEHLNANLPNPLSGFPQNLVQINSNIPAQSPPWKSSSTRTPTSKAQSSLSSSTVKNLPQQQQHNSQIRPQMHTQISFGGTQKHPTNLQGGQAPPSNNHQVPSPPMAIGSPTTSSISKGASGSPRTTNSASTNNKMGQASALSAQQAQNSQAKKSMSILGNPSSSSGSKTQSHQQQQQQMAKNIQQQAQLYFSNSYSQAQSPHSTNSTSGGYFMQQHRRPDQQQPPGGPSISSNGMLSMCSPVTLGCSMGTNDPARAIAAATCNLKGGGMPSQGILQAAQFSAQLPAGFSYMHHVPTAVQVKPAEQKQPAA